MASIKIHDLGPAGSALFQDSESFLNELTDEEIGTVEGGTSITVTVSATWSVTWSWSWTW